jgi:TonB-linked SusC/RagA family outer membrane protein
MEEKKLFQEKGGTWRKTFYTLCILTCCSLSLMAQKRVSGTVTDATGETVIGANVVEKGTTNGTSTDTEGKFALSVKDNAVLQISYVGYVTQEITVGNRTTLNITLQEDSQSLDEIVVIGYGTAKRSDLTSSISVLKASDIAKVPVANIGQAIEGRIAGVTVTSSGMPGSGQASIRIRGVNTINSTEPLVVVDGNPGAPSPDANDIESFQVLKDAAACALYGARGSNGIILITTKKGVKGKTNINYSGYYGLQWVNKMLDVLSSEEYVQFHQENMAINQMGGVYANGWVTLSKRIEEAIANPAAMQHTNWQEEIFRTAPTTKHTLSVSGGGENNNYFFSGSYLKQDGIEITTNYQKVNFQLNSSAKLGNFTIGENLQLYSTKSHLAQFESAALNPSPLVPVYNADNLGGYDGDSEAMDLITVGNPVAAANLAPGVDEGDVASGNIFAEFKFLKDFTYRGNFSARISNGFSTSSTLSAVYGSASRPNTSFSAGGSRSFFSAVENTITWDRTLLKHHINAMAGYTREYSRYKSVSAGGNKFIVREPASISSIASDATRTVGGSFSETAMESVLGRVMYDYSGKYLLTANFRRDGSSKFGKNYQYGNFPSFSAGWRISEEAFMQSLRSVINNLKIRASYGVIGSDFGVGAYNERSLNQALKYVFNDQVAPSATFSGLLNEDLHWEEQTTSDIGFDLDMFGGKLSIVADYYTKTTNGMLITVPIAYSNGISSMLMNAGNLKNKGFELSLIARKNTGELNLEGTLNFTAERNKVTKLGNMDQPVLGAVSQYFSAGVTHTEVGHPIGQFYGYKMIGIYQVGDTDIPSGLYPGDIRFDDMIDGEPGLASTDMTFIGSPFPDFTYNFGLSADYKGFDMSVFFQGVQGADVFYQMLYNLEAMKDYRIYRSTVKDRWTPTNPSTTMPRATMLTSSHNLRVSDRYVEDASFLRLKSISLGYTLPKHLLTKLWIEKLRFYISGQNLLTFTKYSGLDPEISNNNSNVARGIDSGNYPMPGSVYFGIEVNF